MTDAAVLAVIRYSGGYENTQRIMKAFDNYLKIGTLKNSDYKKLAGKNYTSVDELKKAAAGLGGQDSRQQTIRRHRRQRRRDSRRKI